MALLRLFNERVKARPPVGCFEPAARSAFRVLGLSATAAQNALFDAASSVRLALKLDVLKTFESDAAWLCGPVARTESDVRDAVGRLSEPAQRARERLFWFHAPTTPAAVATAAELARAVDALLSFVPTDPGGAPFSGEEAAALHDAALLALAGLVRLDPTLREAEAWARAFELWRRVFACEEFWTLLVAADLKGDYEQAVTFAEVAELRLRAPRVVAGHVAGRARGASLRGELREAARAFKLLRGAGLPTPLLQEYENEVVGPAEDELVEKLDMAFTWAGGFGLVSAPVRRNRCNMSWRRFEGLRPRLAEFAELAGAGSHAARRVFGHAASKLLSLAVSFEELGQIAEALYVSLKARSLAPPDSEELPGIEEKLRALGAGEGRREWGWEEYAEALAVELADTRAPKKLFRDDPKGERTLDSLAGSGDGAGCLTSVAFWVTIATACFMLQWCGVIKTRPTRTPIYMPPSLNIRPNLNFNVNMNYNVQPLNLSPYTEPPPRGTTTPRGRRRRPPRGEVFDVPPPLIAPVAPPSNAPARPANRNAPPRE